MKLIKLVSYRDAGLWSWTKRTAWIIRQNFHYYSP